MASSRLRLGLFCCASAALLAAALLLAHRSSSHHSTRASAAARSITAPSARTTAAALPDWEDRAAPALARILSGERLRIRSVARGFLGAFFRYELGDLSAPVRRRLRQRATAGFAQTLLTAPPRPTAAGASPAPARLASLEITFLGTASPPSALVQGTAIRGGRAEPLSFRFERGTRGWLAAGIGQ
jgi:hypothetical protein